MKYIFLEKHGSNSDPLYKEYLYFITDDKNFDYSTLSDNQKKLIHFKICVPESDCSNILNSFNHNSPKIMNLLLEIFIHIFLAIIYLNNHF